MKMKGKEKVACRVNLDIAFVIVILANVFQRRLHKQPTSPLLSLMRRNPTAAVSGRSGHSCCALLFLSSFSSSSSPSSVRTLPSSAGQAMICGIWRADDKCHREYRLSHRHPASSLPWSHTADPCGTRAAL